MSGLYLPEASAYARELDGLMGGLLAISFAVLALVFGLIWIYVIRYRADAGLDRGEVGEKSWGFEIGWTAATLVVFFGLFLWGAGMYVRVNQPPGDATRIYVVGKQWMWKIEHPGGQHEINALHVPTGLPVELLMTSEDVIHDLSIPAFRIKHDVLPGRYESLWFTATEPGTYHLYCGMFCGTDHAAMIGFVTVMRPPDFANWLAENGGPSMAQEGRTLFDRSGCGGCHAVGAGSPGGSTVRAPNLAGLYGSPVPLADRSVVIADDRYLHDSIVLPSSQVVAGYRDIMPSYQGQLSEADILRIVAYITSLGSVPPA